MDFYKRTSLNLSGILLIGAMLFLPACKRDVKPLANNGHYAQIAFINASPQLFNDLAYSGKACILPDDPDTIYHPANPASLPGIPYLNKDNKFQYPSAAYNAHLPQPWIEYLSVQPGVHTFTLIDTSNYLRVRDTIILNADSPLSIYYTDSMGYFRSLILPDILVNQPGQTRLRFLNLSPDAGDVFFTINEQPAVTNGFVSSFTYGTSTPFVSYKNPVSDTLRINFYQVGDSTDVVARAFLQADPGRSYTVALQGYYNYFVSYPDPKNGQYKSFSGGLAVLINVNN